jgi:peroxiredoxin
MRVRAGALAVALLWALAATAGANPGREATPWLGVGLGAGQVGVLITEVYRGSPADICGIRPGDELVQIDRERMLGGRSLVEYLQTRRGVGDEIVVELVRDGVSRRCSTVLDRRPRDDQLIPLRLLDRPAPAFDLEPVGSAPAAAGQLAYYRGQVVLIAFVSVHCAPCTALFPALSELAAARGQEGLAVLAVTGDTAGEITQRTAQAPLSFSFLRDDGHALRYAWIESTTRIPFLLVLDRDGIVRWAGTRLEEARPVLMQALRERNGIAID